MGRKNDYSWFSRLLLASALVLSLLISESTAQRLRFRYAALSDTMTAHFDAADLSGVTFKLANGDTVEVAPGYRYVDLDDEKKIDTFRSVAPVDLLETFNSLQSDGRLWPIAETLLNMTSAFKAVTVVELIDDRPGLANEDYYYPTALDTSSGRWYILPGTRTWVQQPEGFYVGVIHHSERIAGLVKSDSGGSAIWDAWIVHQFAHAQILPDPAYGMNMSGDQRLGLGSARPRWKGDLLADRQTAFLEGFADFWGSINITNGFIRLTEFCNRAGSRFRIGEQSGLAQVSEMWDAPHREQEEEVQLTSVGAGTIYDEAGRGTLPASDTFRLYSWRDTPGRYVLNNEVMNTAFLYLFWKYAAEDMAQSTSFLFDASKEIVKPAAHNRYPEFVANHLAVSLEEYASSKPGEADESFRKLRSSMLAYALFDLVTHFGMSESTLRDRLQANFPPRRPRAFDRYWSHRAKAKELADPYTSGFVYDIEQAAAELAKYFSQPEMIIR